MTPGTPAETTVNNGEECDDGNEVDDDACGNRLHGRTICGDGVRQQRYEEPATTPTTSTTTPVATTASATSDGDGAVNNGIESATTANDVDDDA